MKFIKGMNEHLLWEFLHFNIFDYFNNGVDYSYQNIMDKILFRGGKLKHNIEIIIKIDGKVQEDCWEKND
jgi:hypothetical protein